MKGVIIFLAISLTIALCVAGYAVLDSEPDFLYYAGYIAAVAPIPLILYIIIKLLYNISNATAAMASTAHEKREKAKSEKEVSKARNAAELERVKTEQAAQLAEQARLAAAAPPPPYAAQAQSGMVPPPPQHFSGNYPQPTNPTLAWLRSKIGRTTLAAFSLGMFMILPQFNFVVKLDGFRIISLIAENLNEAEILSPMWLGVIAICWLIANPIVAYYAPVRRSFLLNIALATDLVLIFLIFKFNLNSGLNESIADDEISDMIAKGFIQSGFFGFAWGYFVVLLTVIINAILLSKEGKTRVL